MPITDLDGRYRPQRLGKVRLGRTEEKKIKNKIHKIPYATEYFVMDDMPEAIREEYGAEPTTLRIEFLFTSIKDVFPHFHKFYLKRGLRCLGDGQIVLYRAAGTAKEAFVCIRNAAVVTELDEKLLEKWAKEYGTTDPMGHSFRCLGFDCPLSKPTKCRPKGRLLFAVQGHESLGYHEMGTGSINAIKGIVGQFMLALNIFGHIDAIPWNLHLRPETVQAEGRSRKIYVPWIEIDPNWLQRHHKIRGYHLRAVEDRKRADIADLYGKEDVADLEYDQTPPALLEAARDEEGQEATPEEPLPEEAPRAPEDAVQAALGVVEGNLEEMKGEATVPAASPEGEPPDDSGITPEEARAILEAALEPEEAEEAPESEPPDGPEVTTEKGNIYERLLKDANYNLKKRGYKGRYSGADEIRQAMEAGGVKGMLNVDAYLDYLTIVLDVKEADK